MSHLYVHTHKYSRYWSCNVVLLLFLFQILQVERLVYELEMSRDLSRLIVHVDMDAFYAAVEMRDCPELKDKPMAVGSMSMLVSAILFLGCMLQKRVSPSGMFTVHGLQSRYLPPQNLFFPLFSQRQITMQGNLVFVLLCQASSPKSFAPIWSLSHATLINTEL